MDTPELEARIKRSRATYDRVVPIPPGFERRLLARIAVTPSGKRQGTARRRPLGVKRSAIAQVLGAAALIAIAAAIGVTLVFTRSHAPASAPSLWSPSGWFNGYFANESDGWLVEGPIRNGTVDTASMYKTVDGGRTWQRIVSAKGGLGPVWVQGSQIMAMQVQSVAGGCIENLLYSEDGGAHWAIRHFPAVIFDVQPIFLPDLRHGWLIDFAGNLVSCAPPGRQTSSLPPSRGVLWRTSDGGKSWVEVARRDTFGVAGPPIELTAWGADSAAAGSARALFVTRDGGTHWHPLQLPLPSGFHEAQIEIGLPVMLDDLNGFIQETPVGSVKGGPVSSYVLRTADGGQHWSAPVDVSLPSGVAGSLQFLTTRRWVAVSGYIRVYLSNDSGQSWREITPMVAPPQASNWELDFASPDLGVATLSYANGSVDLFRTTDGGLHWQHIEVPSNSSH
jgi:photosystem II stability/assembly factor-like uncharacterized protein